MKRTKAIEAVRDKKRLRKKGEEVRSGVSGGKEEGTVSVTGESGKWEHR